MRPRKLKLVATLGGMPLAWGEVKVQNFARIREADTVRICPKCQEKPKWTGGYECTCGERYNHWSRLQEIVSATRQLVERVKLVAKGEIPSAHIFVMEAEEFATKYADATLTEYGIATSDPTTAKNIRNLLIAVDQLGQVVVVRFNDTYEERIALLTRNMSNRVILREIIPINLAMVSETLRIQMEDVTETDITQASQIVKMLQQADEQTFTANDYRTIGLAEQPIETAKVLDFQEILAKIQA